MTAALAQPRPIDSPVPEPTRSVTAFVDPCATGGRIHLLVEGVHCAACIRAVEGALTSDPAVRSARLNLTLRRLTVEFSGAPEYADALARRVEALGYDVAPFDPAHLERVDDQTGRMLLRALAISAFASSNVMMLSLAVWAGQAQDMAPATQSLFQWLSAVVTLPAVALGGRPFFRSAWRAVRGGHTNIDVPIALGILLTTAMSLVELLRQGRDVYFDSATALLFVLLVGRYLDFRVRARARGAVERLLMLRAYGAAVCRDDGRVEIVPADQVRVGMVVLVRAGERLPVDGRVVEGRSSLDVSIVTGESLPVDVAPGRDVLAGSVNGGGVLRIRATHAIDRSHLAEMVRLVEQAEAQRGPAVALADRVARLWTPVIHGIALATFLGWWLGVGVGPADALLHAVSVLIIACPCAIGLAVPAVQVVATGALLKRGVLLRSGDALERLAVIDAVVFDKTGTLSEGQPQVVSWPQDAEAIRCAASMAAGSRHPLARAISAAVPGVVPAADVVEWPGQGLALNDAGGECRLGSASFCGVAQGETSSHSEVWLTRPGHAHARFAFADPPRADAACVLGDIRARGLGVTLLSGDRAEAVAAFAAQVGLEEARGALLPADKMAHLNDACQAGRRVLMVGDGLNDAPALAAAHVSASFTHGAGASQSAADIVLPSQRLAALVEAIDIARRALRIIRENLVLAALYNVALVPVAVLGLASPLGAALAMAASSLTVTLNALRAGRAPNGAI